MRITYDNKILKELLHSFYEEKKSELPTTFRNKNYATPLNVLKNWYLVRTFVINTYKLTSDYIPHIAKE